MGLARPAVFIAEERPLCLHNKIAYSLTVSECRTTELSKEGFPLASRASSTATETERFEKGCSVEHAAAAGERDVGIAAANHGGASRPAGERGVGIASADHADTYGPAGERSQPASLHNASY